jgi:hypothetical protein
MIVVSRRSLKDIEASCGGDSTFYMTFQHRVLRGFSDEDLELFFDNLRKYLGKELLKDEINSISEYAGRSPYLLSLVGRQIIIMDEPFDLASSLNKTHVEITQYFAIICDLIKSEGLMDAMVKTFVSPNDLAQYQLDELVDRGYVQRGPGVPVDLRALSPRFESYLRQIVASQVNFDFHSLLDNAVKCLREAIKDGLQNKYNDEWENSLEKDYESGILKLPIYFNKSKKLTKINEEQYYYPNQSILNVLSINDFSNIIDIYWKDQFISYGEDLTVIKNKLAFLHGVRNFFAHQNSEFLTEDEIIIAKSYCKDIVTLFKKTNIN